MQVGDLVRVLVGEHKEDFPLGMVIGFDEDDDPIGGIVLPQSVQLVETQSEES